MDVAIAHQWLDRLGAAWRDRDPEAAADLFTSQAIYRSHPFQSPLRGRAEITEYWASATSSQTGVEITFGDPLVDGDRVAVEWWSVIDEGGRAKTDAGGLFLTFVDGRCSTLREYWNLLDDAHRPGRLGPMTSRLVEPVAVVTGASRGLGLALSRALVGDGWLVIGDARSEAELTAATNDLGGPGRVLAVPGDVTDPEHRQRLANLAAESAGPEADGLRLLVNNASYLGPSPQPFLHDYPLQTLRQVFEVNYFAPLVLIQLLIPLLAVDGVIINITSDAGVEGYAGWGGYGSSKAALEQLSRVLAAEQPQLRVYWVDPGDMNTRMQQEAFPGEDVSDRPPPEDSLPGLLELTQGKLPSGRYQARSIGPA